METPYRTRELKFFSYGTGHMIKMAAIIIYAQNPLKSSPELEGL